MSVFRHFCCLVTEVGQGTEVLHGTFEWLSLVFSSFASDIGHQVDGTMNFFEAFAVGGEVGKVRKNCTRLSFSLEMSESC